MGMKKIIVSQSPLQKGYRYELTAPVGKQFEPTFKPMLTPKEMLELGVFGGAYFEGAIDEYPRTWFVRAKIATKKDRHLNYFGVHASQPRSVWIKKGWISTDDPRGWFEWYCRYYLGRRIPKEDARQIRRWHAIRRHVMQIKNHCRAGDETCRPRQRQALLHWAYDSRTL